MVNGSGCTIELWRTREFANRELTKRGRRRLRGLHLKNTSSRYSYHYETISCRFALKMYSNYRRIKLVRVGWKRRERTENSSSCANVLHRTLNLVISRRHLGDDGKEMYQNVKRTCRAIVFAH